MKRLCHCIWVLTCCSHILVVNCIARVWCIVGVDLGWVLLFIKYLSLKSRAMSVGVFKGHHRNDSNHIDLGTF